MYRNIKTTFILVLIIAITGCSTQVLNIKEQDKNRPYKEIGYVTGVASGILLFGFIPIRHNDRMTRAYEAAYDQAVKQYDADLLVDIKIREKYYYFVVFTRFRITIEGQAIKYIDSPGALLEENQEIYLFKLQ